MRADGEVGSGRCEKRIDAWGHFLAAFIQFVMPLYWDTPGLKYDSGHKWDQEEDFVPDTSPIFPSAKIQHRTRPYRMNDRQKNQVNRLIRVKAFCTQQAPAFTNTPAKAGDAKFASARTALDVLLPQITTRQSTQASGRYGQASMDQAVEREELLELLRTVNRTAAAIAIDKADPGLMDRFRMPSTNNDLVFAATGDAFAAAITELSLAADFTEHGYEGDIVADLTAEAQDVRDAEENQGSALSGQAGATASLPGLLKQGRDLVKCLDVVFKNRFRNNAEVLGAWKVASHVTSTGGSIEEAPPPTPPTP